MSREQSPPMQKLEEELGELLLSLLRDGSAEDRRQCLRFIEATLRRLVALKRDQTP